MTKQDVAGVEETSLCDHSGVTLAVTLPWSETLSSSSGPAGPCLTPCTPHSHSDRPDFPKQSLSPLDPLSHGATATQQPVPLAGSSYEGP